MTEDEMVVWHHQLNGHEFEQAPGVSDGQGTAEFSKFPGILSAALLQHHLSGFELAQLEFHHLH